MAKDKNKVAPSDGALVETVWKSTGVSGVSRRRVDGVEVVATMQHERAVKF